MGLLEWASDHLLTSLVLLVTFATTLVVSVVGIAGWVVLALLGAQPGMLGSLLLVFVLGVVFSVPLTVLTVLFVVVGIAAKASSAVTGSRARRIASYLERESDVASVVGLSALVERFDGRSPDERADDRIDRLKQRYVDGRLSELEFERRALEVLDQEGVDRDQSSSVIDERLREDRLLREDDQLREKERERG